MSLSAEKTCYYESWISYTICSSTVKQTTFQNVWPCRRNNNQTRSFQPESNKNIISALEKTFPRYFDDFVLMPNYLTKVSMNIIASFTLNSSLVFLI